MIRKLTGLPPHSFLTISLNAFFVDSPDSNDSIVFYVDGKIAHEHQKMFTSSFKNVCGSDWNDGNEMIVIQVPHFNENVEIKIYINTDQSSEDESLGIREF